MEKGPWPQVVEVLGGGPTTVEGASALVSTPHFQPDKEKRKAISESKAPKHVHRRLSLAPPVFEGGPSGSNVFLPGLEVCRLQEEVEGLQGEVQMARQECDEVAQAQDTLVRDCDVSFKRWEVQDQEIKQLWTHLAQEQARSLTGAPGFVAPLVHKVEELA
ncbi:hypothetical protein C0992_012792 [Termitomyces sp. T32_za158]|nr:hypothetical protein C0992_012792 [Termitomyces sp. T32_za158]